MDKKYLKYTVEDLAQDGDFIAWVKRGVNQKQWEEFVGANPVLSRDVRAAREIVLALRYSQKALPKGEVYNAYLKVESFHTSYHKSERSFRFRKTLRYAAVLALVFAVGAAIPFVYFMQKDNHFTEIPVSAPGFDEAKLILSGGEEILLKGKQTELEFSSAGSQVKIDRDSVFDYRGKVDPSSMAQVIVPYGRRTNLLLSDGTKVWLNAGSKLIFPQKFMGKDRKVFLKGEAYFDVFKNGKMPFVVSTDKMDVTVHGTEFNMRDNDSDNELEVVLVEGSVSLKEKSMMNFLNKEISLKPNQKAVYNKIENRTTVESNVEVSNHVSWKEGLLEFNRESILNVFKRLSRYYNVRFVTESSVELNRRISGKLDLKDSLEEVMKVVSDATPITFRVDGDKVIVTSKTNYLPMR